MIQGFHKTFRICNRPGMEIPRFGEKSNLTTDVLYFFSSQVIILLAKAQNFCPLIIIVKDDF